MGKIIAVTSGKGGVGKTISVTNIAIALARLKKRVLVIDLDIGLRNLDLSLGVSDIIVYDIIDVLEEKCDIERAVFHLDKYGELYFLPASQSTDKEALEIAKTIKLITDLKDNYDYILLDCPAGIDSGFKCGIGACDGAVILVTPEISSVRDADRVAGILLNDGVTDIKLIINRVQPDLIMRGDMINIDQIIDSVGVGAIGIIPEDNIVLTGQKKGKIAVNESASLAGKEFFNIARRITGKNIPITYIKYKKNFFKSIFGLK